MSYFFNTDFFQISRRGGIDAKIDTFPLPDSTISEIIFLRLLKNVDF
jgi:hypothetical protein